VIVTLALGIGLNTAVFSVVNAVLMRPLSYQQPERLVWIATTTTRAMEVVIGPDVLAWRDHATTIERVAAFSIGSERIAARDEVVAARIATVSNEFWDLAGGAPALGRLPGPDEDAIVFSHAFFERGFGADASIVGRPVAVNGRQVVVAGVLPASFGAELPPRWGISTPPGPMDGYHAIVEQRWRRTALRSGCSA
jgi:putative ABC transport system permease protein